MNNSLVGDKKTILAGTGDDVIFAGLGADSIDGGAGQDLVSYANVALAVTIDLETGKGGGGAAGDTFRRIEDITGTAFNDKLYGNGAYNEIHGLAGNDTIRGGAGGDYLDGGVGSDTLDYSTSDLRVKIDLTANSAAGGDAQGDQIVNFESVIGSASADILYGSTFANTLRGGNGNDFIDARNGNDKLYGDGGNDTLIGGAGFDVMDGGTGNDVLTGGALGDTLTGGLGADRFVYLTVTDSRNTTTDRDTITDFIRAQGDKIDVSKIDANSAASGDQAFSFIGTGAFTGSAGQLRYVKQGSDIYVYGDVNGDKTADFALQLDNLATIAAGDFIL